MAQNICLLTRLHRQRWQKQLSGNCPNNLFLLLGHSSIVSVVPITLMIGFVSSAILPHVWKVWRWAGHRIRWSYHCRTVSKFSARVNIDSFHIQDFVAKNSDSSLHFVACKLMATASATLATDGCTYRQSGCRPLKKEWILSRAKLLADWIRRSKSDAADKLTLPLHYPI